MSVNRCRSHARGDSVQVTDAHVSFILQVLGKTEQDELGAAVPVFDPPDG